MSARSFANPVVVAAHVDPAAPESQARASVERTDKHRLRLAGETGWTAWLTPGGGGDRTVSATEFERRLHIWVLLAQLARTELGVLVADLHSPGRTRDEAALLSALGGETLVASRPEGGIQVLVWEANECAIDRLAGSLLIRGGRRVRMGAAFVPSNTTTAKSVLDMARCALRRASSGQPLVYATSNGYRPPERRFVSLSPAMAEVTRAIENIALSSAPVLLSGERGAGCEGVARTIHRWSSLRDGQFLAIDCQLTPEQLVCRVLERAFDADDAGRAQSTAAFAGTLYLSRIEDLTPAAQSLLGRLLDQADRTSGVAGAKRLVASTNVNLRELGQRLNPDVYSRWAATINVPALRERREDLKGLAEHFLDDISVHLGRGPLLLTSAAVRQLQAYPFPGNLSELRQELMYAAIGSKTGELATSAFSEAIRSFVSVPEVTSATDGGVEVFDLRRRVQAFEAQLIVRALDLCQWNQTEAAQRLNVPRRTLVYKMRQLGIRKTSH